MIRAKSASAGSIHPDIQRGLDAINLPEVQELVRRVSGYGLAVALPHAHGEKGNFLPLPKDQVAYEANLHMSFLQNDNPKLKSAIPVMWRWNDGAKAVGQCALCDFYAHPGQ